MNLSRGLRMCADGYNGVWAEDFLQALNAAPDIFTEQEARKVARWLTLMGANLTWFRDGLMEDGVIMPSFAEKMSPCLPFAWIRLMARLEKICGPFEPELKLQWLGSFQRSLLQVNFSCGLVYIFKNDSMFGYPFHDIVKVSGYDLMSSANAYLGFKAAIEFFAGTAPAAKLVEWRLMSEQITQNLFRLYDDGKQIFNAASLSCRQPDIWGNGYISGMVSLEKQKHIADFLYENRELIFRDGFTRQISEKGGWENLLNDDFAKGFPPGVYMNGGYWSTGTGFILPALHKFYPDYAMQLISDAANATEKYGFAESVSEDYNVTNQHFLMGSAMLVLAVRAILEGKHIHEII